MMDGYKWQDFPPTDLRNLSAQLGRVPWQGETYLKGKYVWWDPATGTVGAIPFPDTSVGYRGHQFHLPFPKQYMQCPACI